jgi:hypothetical protein
MDPMGDRQVRRQVPLVAWLIVEMWKRENECGDGFGASVVRFG